MNQPTQQLPSAAVILLTAASAATCAIVCGFATNTVLAIVPAALLIRFVVSDYEGTMSAALLTMTGMALIALHSGPLAFLVTIGGAFTAAELASLAARLQRNGSDTELTQRLLDVARNIGYGLVALLIGGVVTLAHLPTQLAIAALVVATFGALTGCSIWLFRRPNPEESGSERSR